MYKISRRVTVAAALVVAVVGVDVVAAGAASAASCTTNFVCLYQNKNFGGEEVDVFNAGRYDATVNLNGPVGFNDTMTSWQSRRSQYSQWYVDTYARGASHCINPNWNVSQVKSGENDKASSVQLYVDGAIC